MADIPGLGPRLVELDGRMKAVEDALHEVRVVLKKELEHVGIVDDPHARAQAMADEKKAAQEKADADAIARAMKKADDDAVAKAKASQAAVRAHEQAAKADADADAKADAVPKRGPILPGGR